MGFTSASGAFDARCSVRGMEYCNVDFETPVIGLSTSLYCVKPGEPIVGTGLITGTDSSLQLVDEDGNVIFEDDIEPSSEYGELFSIDTTDMSEGAYTLIINSHDENGELVTREAEVFISEEGISPYDEGASGTVTVDEGELFADLTDDQDGKEITFIADITGTVSGTALQNYTLEVCPVGSEDPVYTTSGTSEIEEGTLGTIDPTLLMNGFYTVKLSAYSATDVVEDSVVILVTGQAKIGNFSMSFLDMSLPVAGLPVEVYEDHA